MKTFAQLIIEAHTLRDERTDPEESFHVVTNPYDRGPGSLVSFMKTGSGDARLGHGYTHKDDAGHVYMSMAHGFTVHPRERLVDLNNEQYTDVKHRRPNYRLNSGVKHPDSVRRHTPILDHPSFDMPHEKFQKVLGHVAKTVPGFHDFDVVGHEGYEGMKVRDVLAQKSPNRIYADGDRPITMYHGTSKKLADIAMVHGLRPGMRPEEERYGDLVRGHSEHNVYLTHDPYEAANYATRQGINDRSKATILRATIHPKDFGKFVTDEDRAHWFQRSLPERSQRWIRSRHPDLPADYDVHAKWVPDMKDGPLKDDLHTVFFNHYKRMEKNMAFRGIIHPRDLAHHKTWTLKSVDRGDTYLPNANWDSAMTSMRSSVVR